VMQTLYNLIVLLKISDTLEFTIIGAVILLGVIADELIKRVAARRRAVTQAREMDAPPAPVESNASPGAAPPPGEAAS